MSETHIDPQFENQDSNTQPPVQHSGNLEGDMQERPAYPQQGPLSEQIMPTPESSADIPDAPSKPAWYKRPVVIASAAVAAFVAGGVTVYGMGTGGGSHVAAESTPTTPSRPSSAPAKSEAPAPATTSASSSPTKVSLPAKSVSISPSETKTEAPSGGNGSLTQEQLDAMQPLVAEYSDSANTGSPEVIKTLYKDLQYADQTGRADFLTAAIGQENMSSTLGTQYLGDLNQFDQWFQLHPDQRLSFEYVPSDIKPDMSVTTPTWNLVLTQKTGDTVQKYAQTITLKTVTDTNGNVSWVIGSVDAAVSIG